MTMKKISILLLLFVMVLASGCGEDPVVGFQYRQPFTFNATDYTLDFIHPDEGIHPNTSILDDPNNPFLKTEITTNIKWQIENGTGAYPKARFYMWATMLVKEPWGEPQLYVGVALKQLYANSGNSAHSNQAFRAFVSVIENFYGQKVISRTGNLEKVEVNAASELQTWGVDLSKLGYTLTAFGELLKN